MPWVTLFHPNVPHRRMTLLPSKAVTNQGLKMIMITIWLGKDRGLGLNYYLIKVTGPSSSYNNSHLV